MRTPEIVLVALLSAGLVAGCRKSASPEASPSAPAAEEAPAEAPAAQGAPAPEATPAPAGPRFEVRLGPGAVQGEEPSHQTAFTPGASVTASLDASTLPANAIVKATWFDAVGGRLGDENKAAKAGMRWLTFTAPGSPTWAEGSYRVELIVSTGGYASAAFNVGQASSQPEPVASGVPTLAPG